MGFRGVAMYGGRRENRKPSRLALDSRLRRSKPFSWTADLSRPNTHHDHHAMTFPRLLAGLTGIALCTIAFVAYSKVTVYGSAAILLPGVLLFAWGFGLFKDDRQ